MVGRTCVRFWGVTYFTSFGVAIVARLEYIGICKGNTPNDVEHVPRGTYTKEWDNMKTYQEMCEEVAEHLAEMESLLEVEIDLNGERSEMAELYRRNIIALIAEMLDLEKVGE